MIEIWQVDAFTSEPFRGNPAAVVVGDPGGADDRRRQVIAAEMNLSETAFVTLAGDGDAGRAGLRWFTPTTEVDLCGHATLAAAHVLWNELVHAPERWRFETRSGELTARREGDAVVLDFPALVTTRTDVPDGLTAALGAEPAEVHRGGDDLFVVVDDPATVVGLRPDIGALARVEARGVIVSAQGGHDADVTSRFFAPSVGVPEDPVTGSAHCVIGPYWARRLGVSEIRAHQASPRGGRLVVRDLGDRVELVGEAVTVARLDLLV